MPKHEGDTFGDCLNLERILFETVLSEWKRNVSDVFIDFRGKKVRDWRHPVWQPLCTYVRKYVRGRLRTNFDLHYVNAGLSSGGFSDVAFYVVKYMLKPSDRATSLRRALALNLPSEEYESIWSLVRPRHFESEALGLGCSEYVKDEQSRRIYSVHPGVLAHLRRSIDSSKLMPGDPIPSVIGVDDGKFRPLARYYKSRPEVYSMQDFLDFFYASKESRPDNVIIQEQDLTQDIKAMDDFDSKIEDVFYRQTADEMDDLFDPLSDDLSLEQ